MVYLYEYRKVNISPFLNTTLPNITVKIETPEEYTPSKKRLVSNVSTLLKKTAYNNLRNKIDIIKASTPIPKYFSQYWFSIDQDNIM